MSTYYALGTHKAAARKLARQSHRVAVCTFWGAEK